MMRLSVIVFGAWECGSGGRRGDLGFDRREVDKLRERRAGQTRRHGKEGRSDPTASMMLVIAQMGVR